MYDGGQTTEMQRQLDRWVAGDVAARDRLLERAGQRLLALTRRMLRGYPHLRRWEQTDDVFSLGPKLRLGPHLLEAPLQKKLTKGVMRP
jgi:hypothetical protein